MIDPTKLPAQSLLVESEIELRIALEQAGLSLRMGQLSAALAEAWERGDEATAARIRKEQAE